MVNLNLNKFLELQGSRTETEMAEFIGISRSQLWRAKQSKSSTGPEFIAKVLERFPDVSFADLFVPSVASADHEKPQREDSA